MKIAIGKPRADTPPRNVRAARQPQPKAQDHDLPVLALKGAAMPRLDWEALMRDGVQPALLVGGERRWHGRR